MSIILLFITLLLIFLFWFIGGRDPKVGKTVEMHPIEGVTPADIGYLFYGHTRIRDIAVLIVYLATKGYLKIVEYRPKSIRWFRWQNQRTKSGTSGRHTIFFLKMCTKEDRWNRRWCTRDFVRCGRISVSALRTDSMHRT